MSDPSSRTKNLRAAVAVAGVAVLLIIASVYLVRRSSAPESGPYPEIGADATHIVVSDDGLVRLAIPDGALPDGVREEDISVTRTVVEGGAGPDAVDHYYVLEPDGTVFLKPLVLEMSVPQTGMAEGVRIPVLALASDDGSVEIPAYQTVDADRENGMVRVSGEVGHFSAAGFDFLFGSRIEPAGGEWYVDDSFPLSFRLWSFDKPIKSGEDAGLVGRFVVDGSAFTVRGDGNEVKLFWSGPLSPTSMKLHMESVSKGNEYVVSQAETCTKEGSTLAELLHDLEVDAMIRTETLEKGASQTGTGLPEYKSSVGEYHARIRGFVTGPYVCKGEPEYHLIGPPTLCDDTGEYPDLPSCDDTQ